MRRRNDNGVPVDKSLYSNRQTLPDFTAADCPDNLEVATGPCFYSYAYPASELFAHYDVRPEQTRFDVKLGELMLPYAAVQASEDHDAAIFDVLRTTYEAAANSAQWNRPMLERVQGSLGSPPEGS